MHDGEVEIFIADTTEESQDGSERLGPPKRIRCLRRGESFGEMALITSEPRSATVKATVSTQLWVLDRETIQSVILSGNETKFKDLVAMLNRVPMFNPLLQAEKRALAEALDEKNYQKGDVIYSLHEDISTLYMLKDGEVQILERTVDQLEMESKLLVYGGGDFKFFGAVDLDKPPPATVKVLSDTADVLMIDLDAMDLLVGRLSKIKEVAGMKEDKRTRGDNRSDIVKMDLTQLNRLHVIGYGTHSELVLVNSMKPNTYFTLKKVQKGLIVAGGLFNRIHEERQALSIARSDFIVQLFQVHHDESTHHIELLLEACLGGELRTLYDTYPDLHKSEQHAKFYAASVILALECCHQHRIVHRDVKPENVVLTDRGIAKIGDFGLAKFVIGKTYTTCGTPEYIAPEMLTKVGHAHAVDWWMLGVFVYELMSGVTPFESERPLEVYAKIVRGIDRHSFPSEWKGGEAEKFVRELLKVEPKDRLPMRPGRIKNAKESKWFQGFDWDAAFELRMEPPYIPEPKTPDEICDKKSYNVDHKDRPPRMPYNQEKESVKLDWASLEYPRTAKPQEGGSKS